MTFRQDKPQGLPLGWTHRLLHHNSLSAVTASLALFTSWYVQCRSKVGNRDDVLRAWAHSNCVMSDGGQKRYRIVRSLHVLAHRQLSFVRLIQRTVSKELLERTEIREG